MDKIEQIQHRILVVRCQLGERRALDELFLHHNRAVDCYLRRMLNRDDVADVHQEVWLAVVRKLRQLRNPDAFVTWLFRIARNRAISRLKERQPTVSLDSDEIAVEVVEDYALELSMPDAASIHKGMARLSEKHREVLLLQFVEDLSYEQISEVIGCSVGTVRSRVHYAKAALKKVLESQHEQVSGA